MKRTKTDYLVVHCAATRPGQDIGVEDIRRWHKDPKPKGRGWSDVGYHYVIRRDGSLETGREMYQVGAHAKGSNHNSLAICLVGGIDDQGEADANFTRRQYHTLAAVLDTLREHFPAAAVVGHRDLPGVSKPCPCFDVNAWYYS